MEDHNLPRTEETQHKKENSNDWRNMFFRISFAVFSFVKTSNSN